MKKTTTKRKAHRSNPTKTQHDSAINHTCYEYESDDCNFIDWMPEHHDALKKQWDLLSIIEQEKDYPIRFLKQRDLPFKARSYILLPDGREAPEGTVWEKGHGYTAYSLTGFIKKKYDEIPGAREAAESLSLLDTASKYLADGNSIQSALHLYHATSLTRRLIIADIEARWHAGKKDTVRANETRAVRFERRRAQAEGWFIELRKDGREKEDIYRICENRFRNIGETITHHAIKRWFKSRKDLP